MLNRFNNFKLIPKNVMCQFQLKNNCLYYAKHTRIIL